MPRNLPSHNANTSTKKIWKKLKNASKWRWERRRDESIVRRHPVYKSNDLLKIKHNTKQNKLKASWRGTTVVIDSLHNNNLKIINKNEIIRTHIDKDHLVWQMIIPIPDRVNKVHFSIIPDHDLIIKYRDSYVRTDLISANKYPSTKYVSETNPT